MNAPSAKTKGLPARTRADFDAVVIGGGAAGMLASGIAAQNGANVLLLEKGTRTGRKLGLTGKGRCNLTNDCTVAEVIENIPTGGRFLHSALNAFPPSDVMEFFEAQGLMLKTERGGRVFPQSDKASDVVKTLRRYMEKTGVTVKHNKATCILADGSAVNSVKTESGIITCKSIILATGGMSYPATGSDGDGYKMARALGHTITPLRASLVPLEAQPGMCGRMQGLSLKNVRLTIYDGGAKPIFEDFGEMIFTHFGISGPLVLSASAHMRELGYAIKKYSAFIDFKPALDEQKLNRRVLRDFSKYSNRDLTNALAELLPSLSIPVIIEKSCIDPHAKVHSITKEERLRLVRLLKAFRIGIDGPRPIEEAIITSGGVDLRGINPKTMESKLIRGLHFAGEIIDADAYTGGFNLQIAWSTAYAAANGISAASA